MAIANLTKKISLGDSDYLGLPGMMHHISNEGYWYTYHPANGPNTSIPGNSIHPYEWDSDLPVASADQLSGAPAQMEIDGSFNFVSESHGGQYLKYHGGCVQNIGSGVNDITNVSENEAFFFAHIGAFGNDGNPPTGGSVEDDAFYWDRAYATTQGGDWNFYQYHKHLPSNYAKFDDGRLVFDADGYIREADKQYGYLITILAKSGGKTYNVPLARIHTPSVGGAHNSHNDVTLPNTAGINYMPGGILRGSSNRFHAFYLESDGSDWTVYSRTYTSSSGSFTPEVNYGSLPIASANFNPYPGGLEHAEGVASQNPFKLSAGHTYGTKVYWPVVMQAVARSYDFNVSQIQNLKYYMTGDDRFGDHAERIQPDLHIKVGDTLVIENAEYAGHPMYIRNTTSINPTPTSHNVAGASGGGTSQSTLTFTPQSTGIVYYICSLHNGMYGRIIIDSLSDKYDTQIFSVTDANTISPGTLNRIDLPYQFQGTRERTDTYITSVGTKMYVASAGGIEGGAQLFSYNGSVIDSAGQWALEGDIVTNDSSDPLRMFGFKYNSTNTKFFTLLDGRTSGGSSTYAGKGLYNFDLAGGAFDGYDHLSYDTTTGAFKNLGVLTNNYISYQHSTAEYQHKTTIEPEGIASGTSVLRWDVASPIFFNKKEINTGAEEYFFQGIYLQDGRKALVGRVEDHPSNTGAENTGDLILTIVDNENNTISYTFGGTGDDFITGIIEDTQLNRIVMSGYAKGELTAKGSQWCHGWVRNVKNSNDSAGFEFTDVKLDSDLGYLAVGNDRIRGVAAFTEYDKDYNYEGTKTLSIGPDSDLLLSNTILPGGDIIMSGHTKNFTAGIDGLILRMNKDKSTVEWAKRIELSGNENEIVTHSVINLNGTDYIVGYAKTGSTVNDLNTKTRSGVIFQMTTSGVLSKSVSTGSFNFGADTVDLGIEKIKPGPYGKGEFYFVGSLLDTNNYRKQCWGIGRIQDPELIVYINAPEVGSQVADAQGDQFKEAMFSDIALVSYDSATQRRSIVAVGRHEDISLNTADSNGKGGFSFPLAEKHSYRESDGIFTSFQEHWSKTFTSKHGHIDGFTTILAEDSDQREWWHREPEFDIGTNFRLILSGTGTNLDSDAAHPDYTADILMRRDTFIIGLNDSDGTINWNNSFGHMGNDDINKCMIWDGHGRNFVSVGSSTSHSLGRDGVLFRGWKEGFGTGVYHTDVSTSNAYYYDSASVSNSVYNFTKTNDSDQALNSVSMVANDLSVTVTDTTYEALEYNGSYGANGLFTGFLAIVELKDLQEFLNTDLYKENVDKGINLHRAENLFQIHQVSTVGDATADDGNVFAYDVIKSTDNEYYYLAGQVSGNLAKTNTGLSGVYDYTLFQWDIEAEQFRFWQNGTAEDEEIYALTELRGSVPSTLVEDNGTVTNQGTVNGTVTWTGLTQTGTYYYQCGNHASMNGPIIVGNQIGSATITLTVTRQFSNGQLWWVISGTDRTTTHSNALNPTINMSVNDTIEFVVSAAGHPFYIQTEPGISPKAGSIAFCGRTTGQLGTPAETPLQGGYDLFLGIFDPKKWSAEYYNQGSGFNDKAMNIHDIDEIIPNSLALVYTTFGSVNGAQTFGSEDIGLIVFNYATDVWSTGYQTGSETSEEIDQNGKPSTKLVDGRIAVVCNSSGTFADDANTYGLKDMALGIFDFDSDGAGNYAGWKKYQIGSGSSDFSYSVDTNGTSLLVTGYSEATWDTEVHGVFVEFDPKINIKAKAAGT